MGTRKAAAAVASVWTPPGRLRNNSQAGADRGPDKMTQFKRPDVKTLKEDIRNEQQIWV